MNLVLIHPDEIEAGVVVLRARRAQHLLKVLGVSPGTPLKAGIENVGTVSAEVIANSLDTVTLKLDHVSPVTRPTTTLVLAVPRPKVVSRVIAAAASFGLAKLVFVNAWRVEKSYFSSARLRPERIEEDLRLGCEQGAQSWIPDWEIWPRFTDLLEPGRLESEKSDRVVLHPGASRTLADVLDPLKKAQGCALALLIGPEGGWITREHESLLTAGYVAAELATGPLKTDVAVAAALGQVALIRSFSSPDAQAKLRQ